MGKHLWLGVRACAGTCRGIHTWLCMILSCDQRPVVLQCYAALVLLFQPVHGELCSMMQQPCKDTGWGVFSIDEQCQRASSAASTVQTLSGLLLSGGQDSAGRMCIYSMCIYLMCIYSMCIYLTLLPHLQHHLHGSALAATASLTAPRVVAPQHSLFLLVLRLHPPLVACGPGGMRPGGHDATHCANDLLAIRSTSVCPVSIQHARPAAWELAST